jgi:hypothetical protein
MDLAERIQGRILQLAVGFGQGAGFMLVTEDALLNALSEYQQSLERRDADWDRYALQAIEYCRAMGSLAAHGAMDHGRVVITAEDVAKALAAVRHNRNWPLGPCSIT